MFAWTIATVIFGNMKGTTEKDIRNELNYLLDKMP